MGEHPGTDVRRTGYSQEQPSGPCLTRKQNWEHFLSDNDPTNDSDEEEVRIFGKEEPRPVKRRESRVRFRDSASNSGGFGMS